jgi:hypothetical protein
VGQNAHVQNHGFHLATHSLATCALNVASSSSSTSSSSTTTTSTSTSKSTSTSTSSTLKP